MNVDRGGGNLLSAGDQVVERTHGFFSWGPVVVAVDLEDIDVAGFKTSE